MLYASSPARRTRQILGDLFVLVWCAVWITVGRLIYRIINALQGPAATIQRSAGNLADKLRGDSLPGFVQKPLNGLSGDTDSLSQAAGSQAHTIHHIAVASGWIVAVIPIAVLLAIMLPGRIKWIQDAASLRHLHGTPHVRELLAQRALVHQPLRRLTSVSSDPLGDFKRGEYDALAKLEADRLGFALPPAHQALEAGES